MMSAMSKATLVVMTTTSIRVDIGRPPRIPEWSPSGDP